jgi:hypothetical protein
MLTLKDLQNKIEKRISDYIEFDVRELFNVSDYITIYGGAVRDSLADLEIHDIDILCMPDSAHKLREFLKDKYNYQILDLYDQDTLNMYHGISLISEPWTLMNDSKKIIQIIRPRWKGYIDPNNHKMNGEGYQQAYRDLIKNVDLSCCGVFLEKDKEIRLREACKNAITHCLSKVYEVNEWSGLYNKDRTLYREHKLSSRGWEDLNSKLDIFQPYKNTNIWWKKKEREMKINSLGFEPEYDYKIWTEDEYLSKITLHSPF